MREDPDGKEDHKPSALYTDGEELAEDRVGPFIGAWFI